MAYTQNLISNKFWLKKIKSELIILPGFWCFQFLTSLNILILEKVF